MTATPKSVILAVVIFLGLIVLAVIVGTVVLSLTGNTALPSDVLNLGLVALGALAGVLATTRTVPELPAGAVLQTGETNLYAPDSFPAPGTAINQHIASTPPPAQSSALTSLADQGVDPALGVAQDYPRNANADPA